MKKIAVIGVTGLVGEKLLQIFQKKHLNTEFVFFASQQSTHLKIPFLNKTHEVYNLSSLHNFKLDYALFMCPNEVSKQYVPQLLADNVTCIDNSSHFRMDSDVPLVIDEINGLLVNDSKLLANPNCSTIQLAIVLNALKDLQLKRVVASTYQSVSGAGKLALQDLQYSTTYGNLQSNLVHPIHNNFIPHIDEFASDGYTKEEHKVVNESRKILNLPDLPITCLAVRVPVTHCHGIFANIELGQKFNLLEVKRLLNQSPSIVVADDADHNIYPMPILARDTPYVYVGRINFDKSKPNTLNCFIVADNLMRGAAYNAYEILLRKMRCDENAELHI